MRGGQPSPPRSVESYMPAQQDPAATEAEPGKRPLTDAQMIQQFASGFGFTGHGL